MSLSDNISIGRIAPSPSGQMHLGNAFSAALAWAFARSQGSGFIVRLEDLDERCRDKANAARLLDELSWLGIDWDEEPLVQSTRLDAYEDALRKIEDKIEVYPCYCSRADLHAASAPHASDGTPLYAGTCHGLNDSDRARLFEERGGRCALRLHVPDETISLEDGLQGKYSQHLPSECGDFVVRRSDGVFAYQLVCVFDDIASGVTHIVRGSDLLASTPRQLLLYDLLEAEPPDYYHHPLLLSVDGRRLSKRDGDLSIEALRENGTSPEKIIGKIAFLAGQIDEESELSARELASIFDWAKVPKDDIVLDSERVI